MFYLSKILWGVLQPSSLIAVLFAVGIVCAVFGRARAGRRFFASGALLYILFGFFPISTWLLAPLELRAYNEAANYKDIAGAAGIVVLGGAIEGGSMLGHGAPHLNEASERMIEAVRLAGLFPALPIIFSGGSANLFGADEATEAELARRFFERFNILPPRLLLEPGSRNTYENAVLTAKLLQPKAGQKWMLVTSAFHMPRAKALFEAQGFDILAWPVDYKTGRSHAYYRLFSKASDGLKKMDLAAKEWTGLAVAWALGYITWH